MQIHHDGALHWVCSSIDEEGQVTLYDSLMTGKTTEELDVQLALLYGDGTGDLKVTLAPIQQQRGGADCGLFAAAVCLALATGVAGFDREIFPGGGNFPRNRMFHIHV